MGNISSKTSSIEKDHKDLANLLESAKFGRWEKVWEIIGSPMNERKSWMLNCCPENRRWTVLQQAVWWNNTEVVTKLLQFPTIDTYGKAKEGKSEIGDDGGLTAFEIAEKFKYSGVSQLLHNFVCGIEEQEIDTFHAYGREIQNQELGLLRITLAAYKNTFHPSVIDSSKPLAVVLKDIFMGIDTTNRWKTVRDKLSESVFLACTAYSEELKNCESREDFFKTIVNVYTDENTRLYTRVNTALRRQRSHGYRPTAEDLALGPYILMYQLLLMFWLKLEKESKTTYRKMLLTKDHQEKYKKGIKFTWLSFVSSSVNPTKAIPFPTCEPEEETCTNVTVFEFDNTCICQWQPRNIEKFAMYEEEERVYPAGSQFYITNRTVGNGETRIYLKLLSS
ncbi:uncharacterized protein LOC133183791 [Saccostrea echinata]|uniref:uncharacterized protein LOC133183791 n=1 Tax=Saccostrea echinata TaxID=191078 RepID=UPI002A7ED892|nr:uncharacterized protein LOC133183791 [Saccostrea echinata]